MIVRGCSEFPRCINSIFKMLKIVKCGSLNTNECAIRANIGPIAGGTEINRRGEEVAMGAPVQDSFRKLRKKTKCSMASVSACASRRAGRGVVSIRPGQRLRELAIVPELTWLTHPLRRVTASLPVSPSSTAGTVRGGADSSRCRRARQPRQRTLTRLFQTSKHPTSAAPTPRPDPRFGAVRSGSWPRRRRRSRR